VVVDHDTIVRRAIVAALGDGGIEPIADTASGREGVRLATELAATVVIVDPELPDISGIEFVRSLQHAAPKIAILLLSSLDDDELAIRALREGANGFLSKRLSLEILPRIVHSLAGGEAVVTRRLTMRLVERLREMPETGAGLRPVRSALSSREWEVLDLICAGAGTRAIAEDLGLSIETVRSHVKRILRKLGAHSREEAAQMAAQMLAHRTVPAEGEPDELGSEDRRFTRR
jgi:NarL family two-component system response regulator LiaR